MEPAINADLTHQLTPPNDPTLNLMRYIGWFADADLDGVASESDFEPNSDRRPTVILGDCDSGATNLMMPNGATIIDHGMHIFRASKNHGDFVSTFGDFINDLKKDGKLSGSEKGASRAAQRSSRASHVPPSYQ